MAHMPRKEVGNRSDTEYTHDRIKYRNDTHDGFNGVEEGEEEEASVHVAQKLHQICIQ